MMKMETEREWMGQNRGGIFTSMGIEEDELVD